MLLESYSPVLSRRMSAEAAVVTWLMSTGSFVTQDGGENTQILERKAGTSVQRCVSLQHTNSLNCRGNPHHVDAPSLALHDAGSLS